MNCLTKPEKKQPPTLAPTTFSTSRLADFCSEKELVKQTGHARSEWPLVILKELVDNSHDACEEAGTAPVISVTVDDSGIEISDNGPGIPAKTVESLVDFSTRTSSREAYVIPARGAQGNALQTLLAMSYVLDGNLGRVDITAQGLRHEISFRIDPIRQIPAITHTAHPVEIVKIGTSVKVWWPPVSMDTLRDSGSEFLQNALAFTWLNPHLTITVHWFGVGISDSATDPAWTKWKPSDPTSPHWYSHEAFNRLVGAYIAQGQDDGTERSVREFISEFRGLSGSAKQKIVLDKTGLARTNLSALVDDNGLRHEVVDKLLAACQENSTAVKPAALGIIGEAHIKERFGICDSQLEESYFEYRRVATMDGDLPVVVEVAFAFNPDSDANRKIIFGVNWSAGIINPFRQLNYSSLDELLGEQKAGQDEPVTILVHVARPGIQHKDRGKSAVSLSYALAEIIRDCVTKVTARWCKIRKAEERQAAKRWQRKELLSKSRKSKKASLQEAVFSVIPEASKATSGDGRYEFPKRNLYYTTREMIQSVTAEKLEWAWFQTIVTKFEQERGAIHGMYCDPRGYLIEPHTGNVIPLGTREVDAYTIPYHLFNKILYIEKKGLHPLFREAKLAEKYDLAIICAEGYACKAAKVLLTAAKAQSMTLMSLHDADPAGYNIARTLREATATCPDYKMDVIDIGLQLDEALAMGLQTEFFYRKNALPSAIKMSEAERKYFTGEEVSLDGKRRWKAQRIELNALAKDPDRFIAWIEGKLQGLGLAKKLLPPPAVIKQTAEQHRDQALLDSATEHLFEILDVSGMAAKMVSKVKLSVTNIPGELKKWAKELPPDSWKNHVSWLVDQKIASVDDVLAQLAQDAVESIGGASA
ncbi:MAG: ATP-binding protein [Planctomycetota bacterium]